MSDMKLWRYMDFTKFVSMLEEQSLFFCRADKLGDPFEGSTSHANEKEHLISIEGRSPVDAEVISEDHRYRSAYRKAQRKWTVISCWHMNEIESAAMWKLYARTNEAICIRSDQSKFDNLILASMLEYQRRHHITGDIKMSRV